MTHFSDNLNVSHFVGSLLKQTGVIFTRDDIVAAVILLDLPADLRKLLLDGVAELTGKNKGEGK